MAIDYTTIPTADLEALAAKDYGKVSTATLEMLSGGQNASPAPAPKQNSPSLLHQIGDVALGTLETPLAMATGALAYPISKVGGAGMSLYKGLAGNPNPGEEAKRFEDFLRNYYTYQPTSQSGKGASSAVGTVASLPFYPADKIGSMVTDAGYPNLGYNLQTAGEYGTMALLPFARKGANATVEALSKSQLPEKLYGSAVKTPLTKKWVEQLPGEEVSKRTKVLQEGVKEKVPPSDFGIQKARRLESEAKSAVDTVLNDAVKRGDEAVKTEDILDAGLKHAYDVASKSSDPIGAKATVDSYRQKFLEGHGEDIPVDKANAVKRQLYNETKWTGNDPTGLVAQMGEVTKKGTAHQIMTELESRYPELDALNESDAARIGLVEALERSVARQGNTNIAGLGAKVLASRSLPMAVLDATIGHPQVKARLAFAIDKARSVARLMNKGSENTMQPQTLDSTYADSLPYDDHGPYGPLVPYKAEGTATSRPLPVPYQHPFTPWAATRSELELANRKANYTRGKGPGGASPSLGIVTYKESGSPMTGTPKKNLSTNTTINVRDIPTDVLLNEFMKRYGR